MPGRLKNFLFCKRMLLLLVAAAILIILSAGSPRAGDQALASETFTRGINITDYLAYPSSDAWPLFEDKRASMPDADLKQIEQDVRALLADLTARQLVFYGEDGDQAI